MPSQLREINLEEGKPTADDAVRRLTFELHYSRRLGVTVLKIIHGYGSSGTGGRIRVEARSYLQRLKGKREIKDFIIGEQFSIFDMQTRAAFLQCGDLRKDQDLERHNNGVTYIVL
ncbi:MAG: hypothetical protein EOM14_12475 [Clostridia bacterium]|nr:hypothetical protein [Clostridia bacterium]